MRDDPFLTARHFARIYNVSDTSVRTLLRRHGIRCRIAAHQSPLTLEHRINRIAFCETMQEWTDDRLNSIIFTDEKCFCTDLKRQKKVYRPFGTRFEPRYVTDERYSGRISASYWGAIGINGPVTSLVKIKNSLDNVQYRRIIKRELFPYLRRTNQIFMQDNSRIHTANKCMALLARQPFETMDWPALSPDLNPIENVWAYMIRGWPFMANRTQERLDELVQQRWNKLRDKPGTGLRIFKIVWMRIMNYFFHRRILSKSI